jgi:hypothetical protein
VQKISKNYGIGRGKKGAHAGARVLFIQILICDFTHVRGEGAHAGKRSLHTYLTYMDIGQGVEW